MEPEGVRAGTVTMTTMKGMNSTPNHCHEQLLVGWKQGAMEMAGDGKRAKTPGQQQQHQHQQQWPPAPTRLELDNDEDGGDNSETMSFGPDKFFFFFFHIQSY